MTKDTQIPTRRTKRLGVAEAKSKLSEVLREAAKGPTIIQSRGRDLVVVLAIEDYQRLISQQASPETGGASFLKRVEALKQRHGGGVSDFEPPRLDFREGGH
jgi:prevent-host-death family protein